MADKNAHAAIPQQFSNIEDAAEFWEKHDVADYEDQSREVHFDVDLQKRTYLAALEPELAQKVAACAHRRGVSTETLINVWLTEKLATATSGS